MKYYTDGYTLIKNPSPLGGGYTVFKDSLLLFTSAILKVGFTNNEAELLGLQHALIDASNNDSISTDSQTILAWINCPLKKLYRGKFPRKDLIPIIENCRALIIKKNISVMWEGRDLNLAGIYNETKGLDTAKISSSF